MTRPLIRIHNAETNEVIDREMNDEEFAQFKADSVIQAELLAEKELKKQAKCKIISSIDPTLMRPVDVTLQIPSVEKFYQRTKWTPKYTLEDSVKLLLDHYRNQ